MNSDIHKTYLLTWNPGKTEWPEIAEDAEVIYMGHRPRFEWSCGNTKRIKVGDRVFMMRLGWRESVTGIVASGWVTGEAEEGEHWSKPDSSALYIEVEPDVLLDPATDELLDPEKISTDYRWRPQSSGITIPENIAQSLEQMWQEHILKLGAGISRVGVSEPKDAARQLFPEGGKRRVSGYRYERDQKARRECIRYYGTRCQVCEIDMGDVYPKIGEGYIQVHHLNPVADHDGEYMVDPIEDLRPVCPNCHAMLHRRTPPYSITELKVIMGIDT